MQSPMPRVWSLTSELPAHAHERVLPSASFQLLFNLHDNRLAWIESPTPGGANANVASGALVNGPYDRPICIETRDLRRIVGVVLRPGDARRVLGVPADELVNHHVDLEALPAFRGLRSRLGEACWCDVEDVVCAELARRSGRAELPTWLPFVVGRLESGARIRQVQRDLGWGAKTLRRRFEAEVGFSPKRFQRVARFRRTLRRLARRQVPAGGHAELAIQQGYADQAHMIREFRHFSGTTPSAYVPRDPADEGHLIAT